MGIRKEGRRRESGRPDVITTELLRAGRLAIDEDGAENDSACPSPAALQEPKQTAAAIKIARPGFDMNPFMIPERSLRHWSTISLI